MRLDVVAWLPAAVLGLGTIFTVAIDTQRALPLRAPLHTVVPAEIAGHVGQDIEISAAERSVAGMTDYLMRVYTRPGEGKAEAGSTYSVYVGYYAQQMQGKTIHSPRNCLPGSGWEALTNQPASIPTPDGAVLVNRYVLQRDSEQALVLYWYQGRGRIASNEYVVKWDLLRDAALRGRSDEALVRIVVPITTTEDEAFRLAETVASRLIPAVDAALPI